MFSKLVFKIDESGSNHETEVIFELHELLWIVDDIIKEYEKKEIEKIENYMEESKKTADIAFGSLNWLSQGCTLYITLETELPKNLSKRELVLILNDKKQPLYFIVNSPDKKIPVHPDLIEHISTYIPRGSSIDKVSGKFEIDIFSIPITTGEKFIVRKLLSDDPIVKYITDSLLTYEKLSIEDAFKRLKDAEKKFFESARSDLIPPYKYMSRLVDKEFEEFSDESISRYENYYGINKQELYSFLNKVRKEAGVLFTNPEIKKQGMKMISEIKVKKNRSSSALISQQAYEKLLFPIHIKNINTPE